MNLWGWIHKPKACARVLRKQQLQSPENTASDTPDHSWCFWKAQTQPSTRKETSPLSFSFTKVFPWHVPVPQIQTRAGILLSVEEIKNQLLSFLCSIKELGSVFCQRPFNSKERSLGYVDAALVIPKHHCHSSTWNFWFCKLFIWDISQKHLESIQLHFKMYFTWHIEHLVWTTLRWSSKPVLSFTAFFRVQQILVQRFLWW